MPVCMVATLAWSRWSVAGGPPPTPPTMSLAAQLDIPETGAVFTFGKSHFADNEPSHFFIKNDPITFIACGDDHTAVVCQQGRVFVFGSNGQGQLGLGHTDNVERPTCVKWLKPRKAKQVACGRAHTLFLTDNGQLYGSGDNSEGQLGTGNQEQQLVPQYIEFERDNDNTPIKQVEAGSEHTVVLTENGSVYGCGSNAEGQLGLGEEVKISTTFQRIPFYKRVEHIACGYYFTFLVSVDGEVYTFGNNENQRLGTSNSANIIFSPELVAAGSNNSKVACGQSHIFIINHSGKILTLGSNAEGQLGLPRGVIDVSHPTEIASDILFNNVKITQISCGSNHTGFITEKGNVYTCGNSSHQKLCLESIESDISNNNLVSRDTIQYLPELVTLMQGFIVNQIACGGCHTVLLATKDPALIHSSEGHESLATMELPPLQKVPASILNQNVTEPDNMSEISSLSAQARLNESLSKVTLEPMNDFKPDPNDNDKHSITSLEPNVTGSHILEINDLPKHPKVPTETTTEKIISMAEDKLIVEQVEKINNEINKAAEKTQDIVNSVKEEITTGVKSVQETVSSTVESAKREMETLTTRANSVKENLLKVPEGIQHSPDMSTKSEKSNRSVTDSQKSENETIVCNSNKSSPQTTKNAKTQAVIPILRADELAETVQNEADVVSSKITDAVGSEGKISKFFSGLKNETCIGRSKVISSVDDKDDTKTGDSEDSSVKIHDQTNSKTCTIL